MVLVPARPDHERERARGVEVLRGDLVERTTSTAGCSGELIGQRVPFKVGAQGPRSPRPRAARLPGRKLVCDEDLMTPPRRRAQRLTRADGVPSSEHPTFSNP